MTLDPRFFRQQDSRLLGLYLLGYPDRCCCWMSSSIYDERGNKIYEENSAIARTYTHDALGQWRPSRTRCWARP